MTATVEEFAALVLEQTKARMMRDYPDAYPDGTFQADSYVVNVKPGKVYTKVDVGPAHNISGKYMVENATRIIYGIKGYGKVHKGRRYGTLDTINEWEWGGYIAVRRQRAMKENAMNQAHVTAVAAFPMPTRFVVQCQVCGVIGQPQDFKADAEAIAERHREIGGFERPSTTSEAATLDRQRR